MSPAQLAATPAARMPLLRDDGADDLRGSLFRLLLSVVAEHAPDVALWLRTGASDPIPVGPEAVPYLQALNIWFQLLKIAGENSAMRGQRRTEAEFGPSAVPGSLAMVLDRASGMPLRPHELDRALASLSISPTLTAHPTEAKRVTVLEIHRRIYRRLVDLEAQRWTPRERARLIDEVGNEINLLWLTGELRLERPSLDDEIAWGLQFFRDAIYDAVPQLHTRLDDALAMAFPGHPGTTSTDGLPRPVVSFHSWIGGDRDGNPNVTTEVTARALDAGRAAAITCHLDAVREAARRLSISARIAAVPDGTLAALAKVSGDDAALARRNPGEVFRQALSAIAVRLEAARDHRPEGYSDPWDYLKDLRTVEAALVAIGAKGIAVQYLRPLVQRAEVFGFRTYALDIRQNSAAISRALVEIWGPGAPADGSAAWSARLAADLAAADLPEPALDGLSPVSQDLVTLLRLMQTPRPGYDRQAFGPFIVSMTRSADDLLAVHALARHALAGSGVTPELARPLTVVPLFETIEDLRAGPEILAAYLGSSVARRVLAESKGRVEVMLGYSDSNKDGGFFCSSCELDRAQRRITERLRALDLQVVFFHGRGGSASRGGAPAERAIAAQPEGTLGGRMRLTEQGEVVSARYANRGTAVAHLELLASSVLAHGLRNPADARSRPDHDGALEALSGISQAAYVGLVRTPGFVDYFQKSSPVEELSALRIGSRPARRSGAATLDDLRAIPWVFAWTQNRHLVTGWYGYGAAISEFTRIRGADGVELLADMFENNRLFRLITDEVEKALVQADMTIAARYAALVEDEAVREAVFGKIRAEFDLSQAAVLAVTGQTALGHRFPAFRERFDLVRPKIDRINDLQIALLRNVRAGRRTEAAIVPLLQTMNSVAAGLGWTG